MQWIQRQDCPVIFVIKRKSRHKVEYRARQHKQGQSKFVLRGETMEVRKGGKRHDLKQADSTREGPNMRKQGEQGEQGSWTRESVMSFAGQRQAIRAATGGFHSIIEGQSHPRLV